ncbi:MAG: ABC-F family ATP-binding cassette domain-containing protein [Candidatus Kapaibacterium sp.]
MTFGLEGGERVGLIGANGAGKTTLLRIISGEETPDTGRVYHSGTPVVRYLSQNPPFNPEMSVLDTIFTSDNETLRLLHDYEEACQLLSEGTGDQEGLLATVNDLTAKMEASGAWSLETEAKIILDKLGITDVSALMGTLSGGQRKRVALAHALLERPDLLILDEPTNHLDADTIGWLEDFLSRYSGALLLVTHDRYFLERVVDRIIEVDRGSVQSYGGNYSYYLQKKEEEEARKEVESHKRDMLIRGELAWLRTGAKARRTKQKARIERAEELMSAPREAKREQLDISVSSRRLGSKIVEIKGLSKAFGRLKLLENFTHIMQPGERVGIIGGNGTGKTTLLEMILGRVEPDSGTIELGETVVIGYYDQESRALDDETRVIDYINEVAETVRTADGRSVTASQMLEQFLFTPEKQYSPVGNLSGGERRRLYLLRILMKGPNLLVLDEPTNDLDIQTLQALENYLDSFSGCVIVVSHDRYFLDRTVDHLFRFEGEGYVREYPGNYSTFLDIREREDEERGLIERERAERRRAEERTPEVATKAAPKGGGRKLTYKEQKELEGLEQAIEAAEERKSHLEAELLTADYATANTLAEELTALNAQLDRDVERWSELAELMEG